MFVMAQLALEQSSFEFAKERVSMSPQGVYSAKYGNYQLNTAYQPIVKVDRFTGHQTYGFESLVRCQKGKDFTPPPAFFSQVLGRDRFDVERLCHETHIKNWKLCADADSSLFINLDVQFLETKRLDSKNIALAVSKAQLWGIDPEYLVCEVIESKVKSLQTLNYMSDCLRDFGVRIAVDDFGVDYSNIERVRLIEPDFVKLDGVFFHRFATNGRLLPMLNDLVARLQDQGAQIIAEAIETEHHRDTALECGIDLMQGYYFGRPEIPSGK